MNKLIKKYINIAIAVSLGLGVHTAFAAAQTCKKDKILETTPSSDFIDNNDGTVTHKTTGLMWKKCSEGFSGADCLTVTGTAVKKNWKEALEAANSATFAGHSDWRLPNSIELGSIVERACANPAINLAIFPNTILEFYWSSSPFADLSDNVWGVNFGDGIGDYYLKNLKRRVRLVRVRKQ